MKIKYVIEYCDDASEADIAWAKELGLTSCESMMTYLHENGLTFGDFLRSKSEYFKNKDIKLLDYRIEE